MDPALYTHIATVASEVATATALQLLQYRDPNQSNKSHSDPVPSSDGNDLGTGTLQPFTHRWSVILRICDM